MSTTTKIAKTHLKWAIKHISKEGDTDIISTPFEHRLIVRAKTIVVDHLSNINVSSHIWKDSRRLISMKDQVSFRPVSQLDPIDAVLFAALISQLKTKLKNYLAPFRENVFSHNLICESSGEMYERSDGWGRFWHESIKRSEEASCTHVVVTDVVDYYNQIYHHTLENQLERARVPSPYINSIKNLLQFLTDKVSRGIPVGPHPSHVLGELAMAPIDGFLNQSGINYVRYVDDFHIFVSSRSEATNISSRLAVALDGHKLSLNRSKTQIYSSEEFLDIARRKSISDPIDSIEQRFLELISEHVDDPYEDLDLDELDSHEREELYGLAIDEVLSKYLESQRVDYQRIGWLLRRLAQVGSPSAATMVVERLDELLPVVPNVVKYLSKIDVDDSMASELGAVLVDSLENEVVSENVYLSSCILSSFSDTPAFNNFHEIERFYTGNSMLKRKVVLAASSQSKADWIRSKKADFSNVDSWLKRAAVLAAGNLPKDEAQFYIRHLKRAGQDDFLFTLVSKEAMRLTK